MTESLDKVAAKQLERKLRIISENGLAVSQEEAATLSLNHLKKLARTERYVDGWVFSLLQSS